MVISILVTMTYTNGNSNT